MLTCNFQILFKSANFLLSMSSGKLLGKQLFRDRWQKGQCDSGAGICIAFVAGWATQVRQGSEASGHQGIYKQCRAISCSSCYQESQGLLVCTRSAAGLLHSTCSCLGAYETGGSSPRVTSANLHQTEIKWRFSVCLALALNFLIHKT